VTRSVLVALLGGAALFLPGPLQSQIPRGEVGRFEVRGLDFRPDGAWRRRARQVRETRRALLRAGEYRALNAPLAERFRLQAAPAPASQALTGAVNVPVALIAYSNVAVGYPVQSFQSLLFSSDPAELGEPNRPYTLKTFYEELSNGLIVLNGEVFRPLRMDTTSAYYQDNCNGIGVINTCPNGGTRFGRMLLAALDSLSLGPGGDTLWSRFDNDGPDGVPNSGDDDGVVDFVSFLQPTADGACGTPGIWAHRWVISVWNNGSPYVTRTPRRNSAGAPIPGQFLQVNDYIIQSQLGGLSGCDPTRIMAIGTMAHETGHVFGLPDLYDTDAASRTEGIGHWGLMGSGNHARPYSPASYDAWSMAEVGWVTLEEIAESRVITTGAGQLSDTVFVVPATNPGFRLLVENRQAVQSDTAQMNPAFTSRKMPGLLLWLIDDERIAQGLSANRVNTGIRQGVSLMQADGLNQLRTPGSRNRGDEGDPWPGLSANARFGFATSPPARDNLEEYLGFVVDQIEPLPNREMRFRVLRREPSLFTAALPGARIRVNGVGTGRFQDVIAPGDEVVLDVDQVQLIDLDRTRATFLAWSDGGGRTHTLVSGAAPDTVSASFSAEHRVLVTVDGGGSVTASSGGNPAAGVFVAVGGEITLTATAPSGVLFAGWVGDTASSNNVLQLRVARPYDLVARFLAELVISEADATADLLGSPRLTAEQRSYLDTFGNRNGSYDVGDYLAYLRRQGLAPSPAVVAGPRSRAEGAP
jgi:M6 family metalloprotease-like protein